MKQKLLLTFALLLMAVSGAWAQDPAWLQSGDEWDENTNTLTLKSDPRNYYSNNTDIVNLVIEDGVTNIGDGAFNGCINLSDVHISNRVESIGNSAFSGCTGLTTVEIGSGVTTIGDGAFQGCTSLMAVVIPDNVTNIGDGAFHGCTSLATVEIGSGVKTIGNSAFSGCTSLTTVDIPHGVTSIGDDAFSSCIGLTEVGIPASVTSIGSAAFHGTNLATVVIGSGVTTIGNSAFSSCSHLATLVIGSGVETIGSDAFEGCSNLATITVADGNSKYDSRDNCNAIIEKSSNTLVLGCKNTIIPDGADGVTSIGDYAFSSCTGLTSITIPASVTSIGSQAFGSCSSLASVTVYASTPPTLDSYVFINCASGLQIYVYSDLEDDYKDDDDWKTYAGKITAIPNQGGTCGSTVTWELDFTSASRVLTISGTGDMADFNNIGDQPWYSYRSLITSVVIGHDVTSIGNNTFYECSNVSDVTLGRGVTSIDNSVFQYCSGLTSVTLYATSCSLGNYAFSPCSYLTSIYVLSDLVDDYKAATNWSYYENRIEPIDNPLGSCGTAGHVDDVLWYLDLTSNSGVLTISGSGDMADYTSVSDQPWSYYSPFITSVVISGYVTGIGNHAFENCTNLTSVTSYVPTCALGDDAFSGCGNLAKIYVFSDLVDTYKGATNWSDRASIIEAIPNQSGTCGATVTWELVLTSTSGALTISGTGAMADYSYPEDQPWNAYGAFITSVVIGSGVTKIGENAFAGTTLTSITLPASVTSIGNDAFRYCSNLTSVTVYASSCSLGNNTAFADCASGLQIYVFNDYVTNYQAGNWSDYYNASKITGLIGGYCGATGNGSDVIWLLTGTSSNYTLTITKVGSTGAMEDYGNPDPQPWFGFVDNITSVVIEDGVTSIGDYAFNNCQDLSSVTIPNGVTSIGDNAFQDCHNNNLSSITIPASVTSIGSQAFQWCAGLTSVTFASGSQLTSIGASAFDGCSGLTSITIPASVESIGSGAFDNCSGLTSITIPASVTSIGSYAFRCSNLESITVASGNSKYDSRNDCNAIIEKSTKTLVAGCKNTIIPDGADGVTSIGDYAFSSCTGLTSITIPASVTSIGSQAFGSCSSLASVTVYASTPPTLDSYVFISCASGLQIYVYSDLVDDYKANWSTYENKIKAISISGNCGAAGHESDVKWELALATTSGVLTITKVGGTGAMADYTTASDQPWYSHAGEITSVVIEDGVTAIGSNAFNGCANLTTITLNGGATIGAVAFPSNTIPSNTTVTIASGLYLYNGTEVLSGDVTDMSKLNGKTLVRVTVIVPALTVDNATVTATTALATWTACDNVSTYTLQLASDDQFTTSGSLIAEYSVTGTNYNFTNLTPEAIYYARVKGGAGWSNVVEFQTKETSQSIVDVLLTDTGDDRGLSKLTAKAGNYANVSFTRSFTAGVSSTICLPYAITSAKASDGLTDGGKLYTFNGVDDEWQVHMKPHMDDADNLQAVPTTANTPYLFIPSVTDDVTFSGFIANVAASYAPTDVTQGNWKFTGTYDYILWDDESDFTGATAVYAFVASPLNPGSTIQPGEFRRLYPDGSTTKPFRAVMKYTGALPARGIQSTAKSAVPTTLKVVIDNANGTTTEIGTIDTRTGEMTTGDWYSLDGRRLAGKPAKKGLYINNGNKIVIK